jgi:hypothetical protein
MEGFKVARNQLLPRFRGNPERISEANVGIGVKLETDDFMDRH